MSRPLRFTDIADGILRMRVSESHGQTLAERYGILVLPTEYTDSGIRADRETVILPNGVSLRYRYYEENDPFYEELQRSLSEEFKDKYTDYQAIIGAPAENSAPSPIPEKEQPPKASYAVFFSIGQKERFYGLGEGANDRIELRGRAYQNWVRYQYNEIPIPLVIGTDGDRAWGIFLNAGSRTFMDIGGRYPDQLLCLSENDELDLFILSGDSIQDIIRRYTLLTGKPMLLPKWAYGLTYIAPIFANQFEVLSHAERFRKYHIPCDMISLEPDWMEKFYDYSTQKQWNEKQFHMPPWLRGSNNPITFISALHRYGFHLSLWICTRYDLTGEAERQLVNGLSADYGEAWYEHLKPFVNCDVDGFKLDPADIVCCFFDNMNRPRCFNGLTAPQMHNYNQILLTKQMYQGYSEQKNIRPMHHYSGGYSGIQHWSGSTMGDNGGELGAMIWLETLALSGHMNTTIDMDIHSKESVHFGMLVPWAHLNAWQGVEQPWWAGDEQYVMFVSYARMRYRLLPYYYSAALEGHEESTPIVRPMPMAFPKETATVSATRQFMIGENLLVSAYADKVHLPAGQWVDAWTGAEYTGPFDIDPYTPPVHRGGGLFIRRGAILPNWRDRDYVAQYSDAEMMLDIYPSGKSSYMLREDDGISLDYETKMSCHTEITCEETDTEIRVEIGERVGDYNGKPDSRTWLVRIHPVSSSRKKKITVLCDPKDRVFFSVPKNKTQLFSAVAKLNELR